jgi:hypothetical protein
MGSKWLSSSGALVAAGSMRLMSCPLTDDGYREGGTTDPGYSVNGKRAHRAGAADKS